MSGHQHDNMPNADEINLAKDSAWSKAWPVLAVVGVGALGGAFALKGSDSKHFYFSYLVALMFWLALGRCRFGLSPSAARMMIGCAAVPAMEKENRSVSS